MSPRRQLSRWRRCPGRRGGSQTGEALAVGKRRPCVICQRRDHIAPVYGVVAASPALSGFYTRGPLSSRGNAPSRPRTPRGGGATDPAMQCSAALTPLRRRSTGLSLRGPCAFLPPSQQAWPGPRSPALLRPSLLRVACDHDCKRPDTGETWLRGSPAGGSRSDSACTAQTHIPGGLLPRLEVGARGSRCGSLQ